MTTLKEPINLKKLVEGGTIFEVNQNKYDLSEDEEEDDTQTKADYEQSLLQHTNFNCIGEFEDEETFDESEPFQILARKMTNLTPNGEIRKRIVREGYGATPGDHALVNVNYNAYLEYSPEPFDSTYARKKPHRFHLGCGETIPGLDMAIASMKINEKSQFMIIPEFAYGRQGCLKRVPPNETILFEVELLEVIESGAAEDFPFLPIEKKKEFDEVYKYCEALRAKGNDLFVRSNFKSAIKEYNTAVHELEFAQMDVYEQQEKQQALLLKFYTNLVICYAKSEIPKKGCINYNKIEMMVRNTTLKIPVKVYYNHAKCLRMLGDFGRAKSQLRKAHAMTPKNKEILKEFKRIDDELKRAHDVERRMSRACIGK